MFSLLCLRFDEHDQTSVPTLPLIGDLQFVRGWFDGVGVLPACQAAAQRILHGKNPEVLKTFLQKLPITQTQRRDVPTNSNPAEVLSQPHVNTVVCVCVCLRETNTGSVNDVLFVRPRTQNMWCQSRRLRKQLRFGPQGWKIVKTYHRGNTQCMISHNTSSHMLNIFYCVIVRVCYASVSHRKERGTCCSQALCPTSIMCLTWATSLAVCSVLMFSPGKEIHPLAYCGVFLSVYFSMYF